MGTWVLLEVLSSVCLLVEFGSGSLLFLDLANEMGRIVFESDKIIYGLFLDTN
jgi:predicted Rossmann fold nucleotide-binding protein DprA/Smf involved in DNA uptake